MQPLIEDLGVLGNRDQIAVVSNNNAVEFMCWDRPDKWPIFARLLDPEGGHFQISPEEDNYYSTQSYRPRAPIIDTEFVTSTGQAESTICLVPLAKQGEKAPASRILWRVMVTDGAVTFRITCQPHFLAHDYQSYDPHTVEPGPQAIRFCSAHLNIDLSVSDPSLLEKKPNTRNGYSALFTLHTRQSIWFDLHEVNPATGGLPDTLTEECYEALLAEYQQDWRALMGRSTYHGRFQEAVDRSLMILLLMTNAETGAIMAAPTTSLPEDIGGHRNWHYGLDFIRDGQWVADTLRRVGFREIGEARIQQVMKLIPNQLTDDPSKPVLYPIHTLDWQRRLPGKENDLTEVECPVYAGYLDSLPVRFGNNAANQVQRDLPGEVMDSLFDILTENPRLAADWMLQKMTNLGDSVATHGKEPDQGLWESRGEPRQYVYSQTMSWVALDRCIRIAELYGVAEADIAGWRQARDVLFQEIMECGYSKSKGFFVQSYGEECLDAAVLLLPKYGLVKPDDPRMVSTIKAMNKPLSQGGLSCGSLLHRYDYTRMCDLGKDAARQPEGTFTLCALWRIEAQARSGDPSLIEDAWLKFERLLERANHLGLFSEEIGRYGDALGNCPQAYTHLGIVDAAIALDGALDSLQSR